MRFAIHSTVIRFVTSLAVAMLLHSAGARWARANPDPREMNERPQLINNRLVLPAWETDWERKVRLRKDSSVELAAFRQAHPELYAVTEPPLQPVHFFAEYEPVDAIYYAWYPGLFDPFFAQLTQELLSRSSVAVHILHHGAAERTEIADLVVAQGADASAIDFIDMATAGDYYVFGDPPQDRSMESIWMVDYGPYWVEDGSGVLAVVDPRYYFFRLNDDAVPAKLAQLLGLNVFRPDLDYEGGNLFSDGLGTCFATGDHVIRNATHSEADIDDMMFRYFGCEKMIWLRPLYREGTGHIDMFFKNASPTLLVLGEYDVGLDPDNAAVLEYNAALLADETNAAGESFEVLRIPMPDNRDGNFRSYTNGIIVNDLHLMPTYAAHAIHETAAMAVFEQAFPGKTIVGIDSEDIIFWAGAIHCVTRTRPVGTLQQMQPPPADACDGDFNCGSGCGVLDAVGTCLYGAALFCDGASMDEAICAPDERCGWDLYGDRFGCVLADCAVVAPEGLCRQFPSLDLSVAMTCSEDGYPMGQRCADGQECGVLSTTGQAGCREPCDDECQLGETGCLNSSVALSCGEADDGDACAEAIATDCRVDQECLDGQCVCFDECALGEAGCDLDGNAWTCGEDDDDDCTDRVITVCGGGTACQDGTCAQVKGCGCSTGPSSSLGGLLLLLLGALLMRARRRCFENS